ncbi:hypothetical protein AALB16_09930 [Lachnospiraceae bacterium 62-35]
MKRGVRAITIGIAAALTAFAGLTVESSCYYENLKFLLKSLSQTITIRAAIEGNEPEAQKASGSFPPLTH